tara:strand:+ start:3254 stop:3814 length:561 start_codon:yes stop_codon:yes gene_type:complete
MTYIILAGPSSVGKTTYASTYYKNYYMVDSDNVWFELAKEYKYDRKKIDKELYRRMYKIAKEHNDVVLVHTDPTPLLKYFDRKEVTILLLATNFRNLSRNIIKRQNRETENVLCNRHTGYLFYFEQTDSIDNSLYLRKKDLDNMPVKTKADEKVIEYMKAEFFKENRKTTRITPKSKIDYDAFIVI